ncbi:hypothetical protein L593_14995 [Salinarchaeum sp. Harcht-Bsk1]|uniref:cytochrome C oxidase subunit IV family protein n=1 Tax=Salinarchaeum sp. Harcht-Bsk1 TaxID=1333523 RepID=UPI0003423283|nr:cytochrome C oxidase subunit IV family protein [Salinarchaeum sp. Harcht-Bsk1]AGN02933.1 hypothetical protein L593_14995 [Salinarchaeum sp. Harcht-Bsk1]
MTSVRFYAGIYVLLVALVSMKIVFFETLSYDVALALTMLSAVAEALVIAGYYQHLRFEPRSLSYLMTMGVAGVLLVTFAAAFSIL